MFIFPGSKQLFTHCVSMGGDHRCKNVCRYRIYVCAIRRKTFYSNERVARQQRQMCVF